jgi:hypothetical protein
MIQVGTLTPLGSINMLIFKRKKKRRSVPEKKPITA